jgi:hypothetical protein
MNRLPQSGAEAALSPSLRRTTFAVRWILGVLLGFIALNAFGGAWYGLSGAAGVPREWLNGTPFTSYVIPSLFLGIVVGGGCLAASIGVLRRSRFTPPLAMSAGVLLVAWIAVQVALIGWVSWLQPAVAICGGIIMLLAAPLVRPEPPPVSFR